jgi:hypothetical protein
MKMNAKELMFELDEIYGILAGMSGTGDEREDLNRARNKLAHLMDTEIIPMAREEQ